MKYLLLALLVTCTVVVSANGRPLAKDSTSTADSSSFRFVPVPYINYNRATGFALGAVPMAMYKINPEDTVSPASMTGGVGFYTTNRTWFGLLFQQLYINLDKWRVMAGIGGGNFNYQFYISGPFAQYVDYSTAALFGKINVQRRVYKKVYVGASYTFSAFTTEFNVGQWKPSDSTTLHGLGLNVQFDYRDDVYYPKGGYSSKVTYDSYPLFINPVGSDKIQLEHNHFFNTRDSNDVIACRLFTGFGVGDLSFQQQFIVGQSDLRGYTEGRYRGDQVVAVQGEYRYNFYKKWSAVGFGGIASVFNAINAEDSGKLLPSLGAGFRYNVVTEYHMNVGIDLAVGDGDWGFYFRIGEAF
jgi:outer membrane protein assembly factor BamA